MKYLLSMIVLALLISTPTGPLGPRPVEAWDLPRPERVLQLINEHRAAAGCPALVMNTSLKTAAQRHAADMATNDIFSHTGSGGSTMVSRVDATGYPWLMLGENIAAGQPTPRAVVNAWMNSPGHRANILNCNFRESGVGYVYEIDDAYPSADSSYQYYWVQTFGTR